MDTSQELPEGTHVNALAEETHLNEEIDAAIADGITADQISDFLAQLDMAEASPMVDELRAKLIAARG
ncbi:MAG: hypothetical protein NTX72_00685 [Candidatus Uhrbacteria bacterium]|nr:hypothetical protein [Candidatus Uhrbacteria bacterium]